MITDGERLRALVKSARRDVLICSPFIKARALESVLAAIGGTIGVRIITRWRAAEVASGISDLEVFDLASRRPHTELALMNDLHAKLYLADGDGLAGSANVTATALGWTERCNVELLVPIKRSDPDVVRLLSRLHWAEAATETIRSEIEAEVANLDKVVLDEGKDISSGMESVSKHDWLPKCAAPERLFAIYRDPSTMNVVEGTREDGLADLRDLHLVGGLSRDEFASAVRETLLLMPAFKRMIDQIPHGLTDAAGVGLVSEMRPDLTENSPALQWRIVRDWVSVFFRDEFEVAPASFITRLKPR